VCQDSGSLGKQNLNADKGNDDIYTLLNKKGNYSKKKKGRRKKTERTKHHRTVCYHKIAAAGNERYPLRLGSKTSPTFIWSGRSHKCSLTTTCSNFIKFGQRI